MVAVSALIVILAGVTVIGQIAGAFLCKSMLSRLVLLCLSLVGSLAVLVSIIWILSECAAQGDWRAIEDTARAWFIAAAAFSLIVGSSAIAMCIRSRISTRVDRVA